MEDLAIEQLSATQDITAAINSLGDRTGLGLAGSKTGGKIISTVKKGAELIRETPSEGLSSKNIGKGIDKLADTLSNAITEFANNGTSSIDLNTVLTDFGGFVKKEMKDSFMNLKTNADKLSDDLPIIGDATKALKVALGVEQPRNTQIPPRGGIGTSSTNTSSGAQSSNSEVTHTLNINVNSNNPNIDTKQVVDWLNNTDVKQKVITTVNEVYGNAIGSPIPKKD